MAVTGLDEESFPSRFDNSDELDDFLSRPSRALAADLVAIDGDIIVLGVGGKIGPTLARLARNVIAGVQHPLPEWDDLGEFFSEGLRLFCVALIYTLPVIGLVLVFIVPSIIAQNADNDAIRNIGGGMAACVWCLVFPLGLALAIWLPAALLFTAVEQRFGAAFEFGQIAAFIKANVGNYLLAFVVWLVVRMVVPFGFILLCVGVLFTSFWSLVVATYAFAQTWRLAPGARNR